MSDIDDLSNDRGTKFRMFALQQFDFFGWRQVVHLQRRESIKLCGIDSKGCREHREPFTGHGTHGYFVLVLDF